MSFVDILINTFSAFNLNWVGGIVSRVIRTANDAKDYAIPKY